MALEGLGAAAAAEPATHTVGGLPLMALAPGVDWRPISPPPDPDSSRPWSPSPGRRVTGASVLRRYENRAVPFGVGEVIEGGADPVQASIQRSATISGWW